MTPHEKSSIQRKLFSLIHNLAADHPDKPKKLPRPFLKEAENNFVLPIDDRSIARVNAAIVSRPDLMAGRMSLTLAKGMTGMMENIFNKCQE